MFESDFDRFALPTLPFEEEEKKNGMEKRYGLPTALAMVIGIVIGSGIFFKAVKLLNLTGGSMKDALLVIGIVGLICIICSLFFANLAINVL